MNMNLNLANVTIDTNRALDAILANFSDDFISNMMQEALGYKFRPYGTPLPNYPYLFENQFAAIKQNWTGGPSDPIDQRREDVYMMIIHMICQYYNLEVTTDINYEHLYPLCYRMYQLFVSEFTTIMISFFSNFIYTHPDLILSGLTDEQKALGSAYTKQITNNPDAVVICENIEAALDMMVCLDFSMQDLIPMLTDVATANLICSYISDCGDLYKNHFASYIRNPYTRTDVITSVKVTNVGALIQESGGALPTVQGKEEK